MSNSNNHTQRAKKVVRALLALTLVAGLPAWWFFLREPSTPREIIEVSGRIESDDAIVAAKTSGRIRGITVREGDHLKAGQVIATLAEALCPAGKPSNTRTRAACAPRNVRL